MGRSRPGGFRVTLLSVANRGRAEGEGGNAEHETTLLVADDDRIERRVLAETLEGNGYHVETCDDGQAAVERVGQGGIDLVLLDVLMPRLSGLEACRLLKAMTTESFLPVLLVTVKTDTASRVEGLKLGADDYVCKPFEEAELVARVEAMLRIKRLHDQVVEARTRLERLSVYDELTGLHNYRYLSSRLGEEFKRAERYHDPLACVIVDIDHLTQINEQGGRGVGDSVIRGVADVVRRTLREVDVVARFGGDEFLAVLPSTHFAGSVTAAERIWRGVAERQFLGDLDRGVSVSVSVGVALYPSRDVKTKESLLRAADTAILQAKRDGGNRICVFQQQGYVYTPAEGASVRGVLGNEPRIRRGASEPPSRGGSTPTSRGGS
ncbi:MAG: diguanylate cyclase [Polyangiaceae bacterium]|nr:diguanylate cyclase [Polyangiaceae bacterium]